MIRRITLAAALLTALPRIAGAQEAPRRWSVEVDGGVLWTQAHDVGSATATETRNPGDGMGTTLTFFTTSTRVPAVIGGFGSVGVYVTRRVSVEGSVRYTKPTLTTHVTQDFEGAPDVTSTEPLTRYVVDASVVLHLGAFYGGRAVPYAEGGAGYLRDVHDGNALVETGNEFHAGGGLRYWFSTSGHRLGLRIDARMSGQSGGVSFDQNRRYVPEVSASLSYLFSPHRKAPARTPPRRRQGRVEG